MSDAVGNLVADRRLAKAKGIAAYLHREFVNAVEQATLEERQNTAAKAGVSATEPPSQQSWDLVVTILRGV